MDPERKSVLGNCRIMSYLETEGISGSRMIAMNIGGTIDLGSGVSVTMVHAVRLLSFVNHSCILPVFQHHQGRFMEVKQLVL